MNFGERKKKELESDFKRNCEMKTNNSMQNSLIKQESKNQFNDKIRNSFQNTLNYRESSITKPKKKKMIIDKFSNFNTLREVFSDTLDFYSQKLKVALDDSINFLKMKDYQVINFLYSFN